MGVGEDWVKARGAGGLGRVWVRKTSSLLVTEDELGEGGNVRRRAGAGLNEAGGVDYVNNHSKGIHLL